MTVDHLGIPWFGFAGTRKLSLHSFTPLAGIFAALGSDTTIIMRHERILRHLDAMLGDALMHRGQAYAACAMESVVQKAHVRLSARALENAHST